MARITFKAGEDYALKLSRLEAGSERIAKKAIYEAAGIVTDRIRSELRWVIGSHENESGRPSESTGDLEESLGITPITQDNDGNWNAKIGFDGYDRNGVPNQLKARVLESGSSKQEKRPFVRPAVNATKAKAQKAMEQTIEDEIKKIMK